MDTLFTLFGVTFWIIAYVWWGICTHIIADKTGTPNPWLAWIPIANIYLMCKIADMSGWWTIVFFIPLVNIVITIVVWMKIAEALIMPNWLGILMFIPYLNYVIIAVLAFAGKRTAAQTA